jgi:hypothetical protein
MARAAPSSQISKETENVVIEILGAAAPGTGNAG